MTPQYENVGILQLYMLILNCQVFYLFGLSVNKIEKVLIKFQ